MALAVQELMERGTEIDAREARRWVRHILGEAS
jgi:hypothetical protein